MVRNKRLFIVGLAILLTGIFDYATSIHNSPFDIVYRELYLIPIFLGAYWFGRKGGVLTAVAASLVYLPCVVLAAPAGTALYLSNITELALFNVLGFYVGYYRDLRKANFSWSSKPYAEEHSRHARNVLLCIDRPENALKTTRYVVDNFRINGDTIITVLALFPKPSKDLFPSSSELKEVAKQRERVILDAVNRSKEILLEAGFPEESVRTRLLELNNAGSSEAILEEQQRLGCDTIIVGGAKLSKPQEFLFGNLAVKLVRESSCPVLTVH